MTLLWPAVKSDASKVEDEEFFAQNGEEEMRADSLDELEAMIPGATELFENRAEWERSGEEWDEIRSQDDF